MAEDRSERLSPRYDRDYLLSPEKRNQILELWEVEQFGRDSFGDPDAVSLYGMRPAEWFGRGVRVLGRTAVEAARDPLAKRIAATVQRIVSEAPADLAPVVVDPFAGSCNGLLWLVRAMPGAVGVGFEFEEEIPPHKPQHRGDQRADRPAAWGLPLTNRRTPISRASADCRSPCAPVGKRVELAVGARSLSDQAA